MTRDLRATLKRTGGNEVTPWSRTAKSILIIVISFAVATAIHGYWDYYKNPKPLAPLEERDFGHTIIDWIREKP
jgi:hypothetical protein